VNTDFLCAGKSAQRDLTRELARELKTRLDKLTLSDDVLLCTILHPAYKDLPEIPDTADLLAKFTAVIDLEMKNEAAAAAAAVAAAPPAAAPLAAAALPRVAAPVRAAAAPAPRVARPRPALINTAAVEAATYLRHAVDIPEDKNRDFVKASTVSVHFAPAHTALMRYGF